MTEDRTPVWKQESGWKEPEGRLTGIVLPSFEDPEAEPLDEFERDRRARAAEAFPAAPLGPPVPVVPSGPPPAWPPVEPAATEPPVAATEPPTAEPAPPRREFPRFIRGEFVLPAEDAPQPETATLAPPPPSPFEGFDPLTAPVDVLEARLHPAAATATEGLHPAAAVAPEGLRNALPSWAMPPSPPAPPPASNWERMPAADLPREPRAVASAAVEPPRPGFAAGESPRPGFAAVEPPSPGFAAVESPSPGFASVEPVTAPPASVSEPTWQPVLEEPTDQFPRVQATSRDVQAPPRDVHASSRDVQAPPRDFQAPPRGVEAPPRDFQAPPSGVEAPPRDVQASSRGVEAPARDFQAPPRGGEAPVRAGQAEPRGGEAPARGVQAESPAAQERAPFARMPVVQEQQPDAVEEPAAVVPAVPPPPVAVPEAQAPRKAGREGAPHPAFPDATARTFRILPIAADLMPLEITGTRHVRRVRRGVITAAVLVVALVAGWYGYAVHEHSKAEDDRQAILDTSQDLTRQKHKQYDELTRIQSESGQIDQRLQQVLAYDLSWSTMLASLRETAAAKNVKLSGITAALSQEALTAKAEGEIIGTVTLTGKAPSKDAVAAYVDALVGVAGVANPFPTDATQENDGVSFTIRVDITKAALGGRFTSAAPSASPSGSK
ncbi:hypothetical protein [Dactylosporangium sp. CS-033363]|uniref:hypothetical protein n=1 Tax=Dactylosporangium sp. CS-033363 TaxID=3239935 RepID=UPI003D904B01